MMDIQLRKASIADLKILQYWDTQPHVIASDPDDDWNWEIELQREPSWRIQLMAEWKGKAIGFVQIIDPQLEETHYWGDIGPGKRAIDIWIGEEALLGLGLGTEMMHQAIELCFRESEVKEILVDPLAINKRAHRFYERLGFEFVEPALLGGTDQEEQADECFIYSLT